MEVEQYYDEPREYWQVNQGQRDYGDTQDPPSYVRFNINQARDEARVFIVPHLMLRWHHILHTKVHLEHPCRHTVPDSLSKTFVIRHHITPLPLLDGHRHHLRLERLTTRATGGGFTR